MEQGEALVEREVWRHSAEPEARAGTRERASVWLTLWDVSYLDGVFVAVGSIADLQHRDGLILTSDDGHHWSEAYRGEELDLKNVAGGGSRWVALDGGDLDPPQTNVVTSEDGLSWQQLAESPPFASAEVIWTGSKFLALGFGLVPPGPYDPEESIPEPLLWESTTGSAWEQFGETRITTRSCFRCCPDGRGSPGIVAGGNHGIGVSADDGGSWNWTSFRDLTGEEYVLGNVTAAYWDGTRFGATTTYDCCYGEVAGARSPIGSRPMMASTRAWEEASDAFYSVTFRGEVGVATGWSSGGLSTRAEVASGRIWTRWFDRLRSRTAKGATASASSPGANPSGSAKMVPSGQKRT